MYRAQDTGRGMTRMELLPTSAPVYGGGLSVAFLPEDYILSDGIRAFLVFKGSKQRQVTEAKISLEDNAFHAVIPDHEPPETVALSAYIQLHNNECQCIGTEQFTYYLDQTCYLARYLADSVHNLDSLEDWDNIQGANFSLEQEDFTTLDERLTSAFQHLILPPNWSMLGDPGTEHIPRETLFHFATRLGLSTFVTLLLEKPSAGECLILRNRHEELAKDIALERGFEGLADLMTDPHAHGVIRWESKERVGKAIILKRHSFGTVSTTSEKHNNMWPPLDEEIEALSRTSAPPATPIPYKLDSATMWEDEQSGQSLKVYYDDDYENDEFTPSSGTYASDYSDLELRPRVRDTHRSKGNEKESRFLTDNLKHLHEISDGIHYLRHKDIERLREGGGDESSRLSNSCPDLAQDISRFSEDDSGLYESPTTPVMPRNRRALPLGISQDHLEAQLLAADNAYAGTRSQEGSDRRQREEYGSGEPSPNSLQRRHSWHSSESLSDDSNMSPTQKRRFSLHDDEEEEDGDESKQNQDSSVKSPTVIRRGAHKNMAMFSIMAPQQEEQDSTEIDGMMGGRRSKSLSANNNNNMKSDHGDADRRYTISEGVIPEEHRSSLLALQELVKTHDAEQEDNTAAANIQESVATTTELSLSEFLSDPTNFNEDRAARLPSVIQSKPPVPPRPGFAPAKKIVTRKLSFLGKMRNSTRNKPKEKGKVRTLAELKFGIGNAEKLQEEDDTFDSDFTKDQVKKIKRPSIIQRPQSMMLNRQAQYPVGNPANPYHAGPNPAARSRPISTASGFNHSTLTEPNTVNKRSSFHDEEDGGTPPNLSFSNQMRLSASYESLDEAALDTADLEADPDLCIKPDEPEAWSVTVDKKILKKMGKKEVKRQENIFEFIQTERNYLTTLKIMQKIFARGMLRELHMDQSSVEKLFPYIDEHVEYVSQFVNKLNERQITNKIVDGIGDILVTQWENESGNAMKRLLGDFCSKQNEITSYYKELMKTDKKFQIFMKKCDKNPMTRRQGVPGCGLLVTQRITKYPIMLQTLVENSNRKDHKEDYNNLERARDLSREIAKDVDEQVQAHEREQLLIEIYQKTESRSATSYKDGRKFDRKDLLKRNRKLLYTSNSVQWNIKDNKKYTEVYLLLLSDCIVFLQESNGKYTFPSGQPSVVSLQRMIVREVANDEKGLYLMSMSSQQMYTLKLGTCDECKTLTHTIRLAVGNCPDEDEGIPSEDEEEKRIQDQRLDKARQMITQLEMTDQRINRLLTEKMVLFRSLAESVDRGSAVADMHFHIPQYSSEESNKFPPGGPILIKAIEQVSKLSHAFYAPGGLSRHPSSVGEHGGSSRSTPSLPKRSDTFGGFDNGREPPSPRSKWLNSSQSDSKLTDIEINQTSPESSNRDSGLIDTEVLPDPQVKKAWESYPETSSEVTSPDEGASQSDIPPTSDQVTALTTLNHLLSEYQSFAAQQDTVVEKLQLQIHHDRSNSKKRPGGSLQEAELKRNQVKQQEQMDDLRKQQQQLRVERDQWEKQVERFQRSLDNERREFEEEKSKIQKDKDENERQKDEIQKSKDYYQREVARLKELQRMHTSASTSSLPSATNRNNSNNSLDTVDLKSSSDYLKPPISISKSHSNLQASTTEPGSKPPSSPIYENASEYPRTFPGPKRDSVIPSSTAASHQLPIHLQYSATNQLSSLQAPKQQDINSKLSKLASSSSRNPGRTGSNPGEKSLHQMIPSKLSRLSNLAQTHGSSSKKLHIV